MPVGRRHRASIKYRFDHADNPLLVGGGIQIFLEDRGEPRDGERDATSFRDPETQAKFEAGGPTVCQDPNSTAYTPGEEGNFVVHDAD